jgi:hypothetical protein
LEWRGFLNQEIEFFRSGDVLITSSKIIFGRKTHAVRNVSSAETTEEIIWWPTVAGLILGFFWGVLTNAPAALLGFVIGMAIGAVGTHFTGGFINHKLILTENAGRVNVFETRNGKVAQKLEQSVIQAISR